MAGNYKQPGEVLDLIAPSGGVVSGLPYIIGGLVVIALNTAAQTLPFRGQTCGVWTLTKKAGTAWAAGDRIYWDANPGECTKVAADGKFIGIASEAAGSADTTGVVRINPGAGAAQGELVAAAVGVPVNDTGTTAVVTVAEFNALRTALINAGVIPAA